MAFKDACCTSIAFVYSADYSVGVLLVDCTTGCTGDYDIGWSLFSKQEFTLSFLMQTAYCSC